MAPRGNQVKRPQDRVMDGGKYSARAGRLTPGSLPWRKLPHGVLPCLAMRPPSKLNKFSCLRTPGRPATAWLLDSATPHMTSLWESWRHGEGEAWIAVFNLLSPPSLQQSMWGPQVECLLASVRPLCTNECNERCPFFRSH